MSEFTFTLSEADLDAIAERIASRLIAAGASSAMNVGDDHAKLLWTEAEAAMQLGISRFTLKKWREAGFVRCHSPKRPISYRREHIDAAAEWMRTRHLEEPQR